MAACHTSVIVTTTVVDTRTRDQCSFPIKFRPQAMTIYMRFVELGTASGHAGTNNRLWHLGGSTDPRLLASGLSSGVYQFVLDNGPTQAIVNASGAPSYGARVEHALQVSATGALTIIQSINEGTQTSATSASPSALPTAWSTSFLWLNSIGTGTVGYAAFRNVEIVAGTKTMQQMRVLAGTD